MRPGREAGLPLAVVFFRLILLPAALFGQQEQDEGQFQALLANGQSVHGTVTGIRNNELTLKDEEGQVYKVETGPNTFFRRESEPIRIDSLHPGDVVFAAGEQDDKTGALGAVFVIQIDPKKYAEAKAAFGRTWTAGRIEGIHDLEITILRPDHQHQTIEVDENTSFRRQHDSITLGEIKTGDNISARGSLQGNKFRATILVVGSQGQRLMGPPSNKPQN